MRKAVCDTSALVKLRKGGAIDCLGQLFDKVYIPPAVRDECTDERTLKALEKPFFEVREATHVLSLGMGRGEREAISLAKELDLETLIIDDKQAYKKAEQHGLFPQTSFDILILGRRLGYLSSVKPILDAMRADGEGVEDDTYNHTLHEAGEM